MDNVKNTGLSGVAIVALSAAIPLLQAGQLYEGIAAGVLGLASLVAKYYLR